MTGGAALWQHGGQITGRIGDDCLYSSVHQPEKLMDQCGYYS